MRALDSHLETRQSEATGDKASRLVRFKKILHDVREADAYVASFSENGDSLSQWRAYCPGEGGYAIGLETAKLSAVARSERLMLLKCEYDVKQQDRILGLLIDSCLEFLDDASSRTAYPVNAMPFVEESAFGMLSSLAAAVMKHPSFSEEAEWRLIWLPPMGPEDVPIAYRAGRYSLIPYREIPFRNPDGSLPIIDLVVGPTPYPNLSIDALKRSAPSFKISPAGARVSETPFREW